MNQFGDDRQAHWDAVYEPGDVEHLGWYEDSPEQSIEMIKWTRAPRDALILDVGSGASTLIPNLLSLGYEKIVATDVSARALAEARGRMPDADSELVTWVVDDVLRPDSLARLAGRVHVWHDRAMFHFLIDDGERDLYLETLHRLVRPGGHVIIAAFSLDGVDRCSGLPVRRYNEVLIGDALGPEYRLVHSFGYKYQTPSGEQRPYVYTLFCRDAGQTADR